MTVPAPLVSVLISTYNRSRLLRRAINTVLMQDFRDFELVIIDDHSTDDTSQVVASFSDPRIRYIRNETNVGAKLGDRAHVQRFVYELMRGSYFVYLCDDDYWLFPDLLRRQVDIFQKSDNVAFVMGNQLCYFLTTPDSYFGRGPDDTMTFTLDNIEPYFDLKTQTCKTHHFSYIPNLFSKEFLTSDEYLTEFASEPTTKNRIVGATLYSREHFIRAGAMKTEGSKWQAGYEFLMGPACVGNVGYLNDPCIVTEIRAANASFQRTQVEHYLDSIKSIEIAFDTPLSSPILAPRWTFLRRIRNEAIRNLSCAFLGNSLTIRREGALGMCSEENIRYPVTPRLVCRVLWRNRAWPGRCLVSFFHLYTYGRYANATTVLKQRLLRIPRYLKDLTWRSLPSTLQRFIRSALR